MATAAIDTSELGCLKSCREKLREIVDVIDAEKDKKEEMPAEEKLREIERILKGGRRQKSPGRDIGKILYTIIK